MSISFSNCVELITDGQTQGFIHTKSTITLDICHLASQMLKHLIIYSISKQGCKGFCLIFIKKNKKKHSCFSAEAFYKCPLGAQKS